MKTGSALTATVAALYYFWMVSAWGGYVFIINLIPMHVFALMLMGRFSPRIYVAYSTFYVIGTLSSMLIPFVNFQPVGSSEHMAALGVFGLCQLMAFSDLVRSLLPLRQFQVLLRSLLVLAFGAGLGVLVLLTTSGLISPWTGRFYSLWDTGYAAKYIPIIASVSEHQPTPWTSWFFDLQCLMFFFPAGVYYCFQELKDEHVFVILYAITASYFSSVMVRLMLTLTPVVCVGAALAVSNFLDIYLLKEQSPPETNDQREENEPSQPRKKGSGESSPAPKKKSSFNVVEKTLKKVIPEGIWSMDTRLAAILPMMYVLAMFGWHCTYITSNAYSSPSVVLASRNHDGSQYIIDDFREAYYWLRQNTPPDTKVMSWWDYGYQIAGMADRPTLVDNNTWNNTHIATVGRAMSSPEDVAYGIMKQHDVDYVLVIFGGMLGYSGDDINKFLWMVRISQGIWPDKVVEQDFFSNSGEYRVDGDASPTMKNSLMYKTSYYRFGDLYGQGVGQDRVRGADVPTSDIHLDTIEEAFSSEHLIVRLYKVKKLDVFGRVLVPVERRRGRAGRIDADDGGQAVPSKRGQRKKRGRKFK